MRPTNPAIPGHIRPKSGQFRPHPPPYWAPFLTNIGSALVNSRPGLVEQGQPYANSKPPWPGFDQFRGLFRHLLAQNPPKSARIAPATRSSTQSCAITYGASYRMCSRQHNTRRANQSVTAGQPGANPCNCACAGPAKPSERGNPYAARHAAGVHPRNARKPRGASRNFCAGLGPKRATLSGHTPDTKDNTNNNDNKDNYSFRCSLKRVKSILILRRMWHVRGAGSCSMPPPQPPSQIGLRAHAPQDAGARSAFSPDAQPNAWSLVRLRGPSEMFGRRDGGSMFLAGHLR